MLPLKRTKELLFISISTVLVALIAYVVLLFIITGNMQKISDLEFELAIETQKELQLGTLMELVEETTLERATIDKFFVTDDTLVEFITTIELLANQAGVDLEISQVSIASGGELSVIDDLIMGVNVFGSWTQVYKFFQILVLKTCT